MSATAPMPDDLIGEIASRVILMPDDALAGCAYYAIMNLYRQCGLEPPTIEQMEGVGSAGDPAVDGLKVSEVATCLYELKFPGIIAIGAIPAEQTAANAIPLLFKAGWRMILIVGYWSEITPQGGRIFGDKDFIGMPFWCTHGVVPFAGDDDGLFVIVGWSHQPIQKIGYGTVPAGDWHKFSRACGIMREFVMVLPKEK